MTTTGIKAYGIHIPWGRLDRSLVGGRPGRRTVAWHDENTTSMGVEAARRVLAAAPQKNLDAVLFSTTAPAYLDKTNAGAIHAALGLDQSVPAYDLLGSVRSTAGALKLALAGVSTDPSLVVLSDIRTGRSGSTDERQGGDAAAALLIGRDDGELLAELEGRASASAEFLDRWRLPGDLGSSVWEERFGEQAYVPLIDAAVTDAFKQVGIGVEDVDLVVTAGLQGRAIKSGLTSSGLAEKAADDDLADVFGNTGAVAPGLALIDAIERSKVGDRIALIVVADGVDVFLFRRGAGPVPSGRSMRAESELGSEINYQTYLVWRGALEREPARRPDPERPAAPPSARRADWKFAFVGSRCTECGTRHMPPQRSCIGCGSVDAMEPEPMSNVLGTIATFTVDHLAFSLSPPTVVAAVDFDGGGRFQCELTDLEPDQLSIGDRVEMTFRCLFTAGGIRNYFWKARPIRER